MNDELSAEVFNFQIKELKNLIHYFECYKDHVYNISLGKDDCKLNKKDEAKIQKLLNFLLYQVFIFYKKKGFLSHINNEKYKSLSHDQCYEINDRGDRVKIHNFDDYYFSQILKKDDKSFLISFQMTNFLNDFILNRLFSIPISHLKSKDEYLRQLKNPQNGNFKESDTEKIKAKLNRTNKDILLRISSSKGFFSIASSSKNSIPLFISILQNSMQQFYVNLPSGNDIYDRQIKNILNVMKPGIASGYNADVAAARRRSMRKHNVKFEYFSGPGIDEPYCVVNGNDRESNYSELERINIMLEIGDTIPKRPFSNTKNWRPYTTNSLVLMLKKFSIALNGRVYLIELIKFFSESLKEANNFLAEKDSIAQSQLITTDVNYQEINWWENQSDKESISTSSSIDKRSLDYRRSETFVNNFLFHLLEEFNLTTYQLSNFGKQLKKAISEYEDQIINSISFSINEDDIDISEKIVDFFRKQKNKKNLLVADKLVNKLNQKEFKYIENFELLTLLLLIENIENLNN